MNASNPTLHIVSQHYAPSTAATAQLITDLSERLFERSHNIHIITSTPQETIYHIPLTVLSSGSSSKRSLAAKSVSGLIFTIHCLLFLPRVLKPHDHILLVSNPPFIGSIGPLLRFACKARYTFLFQDLFPHSAVVSGVLPSKGPLCAFFRALMRWICNYSSDIIVLSNAMKFQLISEFNLRKPPVVIHNWSIIKPSSTRFTHNKFIHKWDLGSQFVVQYSGNLGRLHDIMTILEAARLQQSTNTTFLFIGGGPKDCQVHAYKSFYSLNNILTKPFQARDLLPESLAACHVAIVSVSPGSESAVAPSKLYGILASSKPVILIMRSNTGLARAVIKYKVGLVVEPGDPVGLSDAISILKNSPELVATMGANAYCMYTEKYSQFLSVNKYESLFFR